MSSRRADHRPACTGCRCPRRSGHWGIKHYDGMGEQGIRLRQYLRINVSEQPAWPAHPRMESGFQGTQTENVHNLVAVVYFGVEHLRAVNEHYGRRIANTVLRSVSMRLSRLMPENATLSRVSGAEFAMIITNVTSTDDVEELTVRMRNLARPS